MLIEIAMWVRIDKLNEQQTDRNRYHEDLIKFALPQLEYFVGRRYRDAVECCLDASRLDVDDDDGKQLMEAFSREVLGRLEACRA